MAHSSKDKQQSRPTIRVAPDGISDGVIATDLEGRIRHMNPAAERITGWSLQAAKGKDLTSVYRTADPQANRTTLTRKDGTEVARGFSGDGYRLLVAPAGTYDIAVDRPGRPLRLPDVEVKANLTYLRTF